MKVLYEVTVAPVGESYTFMHSEYAHEEARKKADKFAANVFGGKVIASKSPQGAMLTEEYEGLWITTYSIFSQNQLVGEVKVTESWTQF